MKAKVVKGASGPLYFAIPGEVLTSRKKEAGKGVRYMNPLYLYDLKKMGCLEIIESTPVHRKEKRPLRNVGKVSGKDGKIE